MGCQSVVFNGSPEYRIIDPGHDLGYGTFLGDQMSYYGPVAWGGWKERTRENGVTVPDILMDHFFIDKGVDPLHIKRNPFDISHNTWEAFKEFVDACREAECAGPYNWDSCEMNSAAGNAGPLAFRNNLMAAAEWWRGFTATKAKGYKMAAEYSATENPWSDALAALPSNPAGLNTWDDDWDLAGFTGEVVQYPSGGRGAYVQMDRPLFRLEETGLGRRQWPKNPSTLVLAVAPSHIYDYWGRGNWSLECRKASSQLDWGFDSVSPPIASWSKAELEAALARMTGPPDWDYGYVYADVTTALDWPVFPLPHPDIYLMFTLNWDKLTHSNGYMSDPPPAPAANGGRYFEGVFVFGTRIIAYVDSIADIGEDAK